MRKLTTSETYFYFKNLYKDAQTMQMSFCMNKKRDDENKFKNKKYLLQSEYGYYDYKDIIQMLKYNEEVKNTIHYAQQLIVDIEAILNYNGIVGAATKLSKITGLTNTRITYLDFSYESALKCIKNIEDKIKGLSLEAIRDLKQHYLKVCEG